MTPTTIIVLNGALALLTLGGDPWVVSGPLPLAQVVAHERERRAA